MRIQTSDSKPRRIIRRAAERNLPVEPEALAESVKGNRLAPQAHLDAVGKFVLATRLNAANRIRPDPKCGPHLDLTMMACAK